MTHEPSTDRTEREGRYDNVLRFLWGASGTALTASIVGAPLGIPMLFRAHAYQRRIEGPTAGGRGTVGQVRRILGQVLCSPVVGGRDGHAGHAVTFDGGTDRNPPQ